jgi:hypothetical protein
MKWALARQDPEMIGEIVDCLAAFGVTDTDPLIVEARTRLLETQREDGGWGDEDDDTYGYFHTLWTAIDGLRDHKWRRRTVTGVELRRALHQLAVR